MTSSRISDLHYYAAARNDGWAPGDEDTPKQYCAVYLTDRDVRSTDVEFWRDEYNWWKDRP